ncbi:MAG: signal peptidase I [Caldicoprobacterales bacterium]|jgi:signal peptidase I|nr:signal peptidase I [Clostridiales bacterium]
MNDVKSDIKEWIQAILIAIVVSIIIRMFLFETTLVYGKSMESTLHDRDRVIINKLIYQFNLPKRGDIVVFKNPENTKENFVKRVIGLPGDTIEIVDEKVYVNDELLDEPYINEPTKGDFPKVEVPPDTIFVMGDNRNSSQDSRNPKVGFVPIDNVIGKAQLRIWPLDDWTLFK